MKSIIFAALAFLVALVVGQDLSQLPACATSCAAAGIGATGCAVTNAYCVCSDTAFLDQVQSCIATACDAADQETTLQFAKTYCATGNITVILPSSLSNSSSSSAASTGTSTISTSSTIAGTAAATTTSTTATSTSTSSGAAAPAATGASKQVVQALGLGFAASIIFAVL